jgi:hypothetical protein
VTILILKFLKLTTTTQSQNPNVFAHSATEQYLVDEIKYFVVRTAVNGTQSQPEIHTAAQQKDEKIQNFSIEHCGWLWNCMPCLLTKG